MGRLAERAGALVGSSGFGKDLETVGKRNVTIIEHVGNAAITLADALRHVVVAAGPLTLWLARLSEKGADWILAQVEGGPGERQARGVPRAHPCRDDDPRAQRVQPRGGPAEHRSCGDTAR
jgi:hypothetical protein